MKTFIDYFLKAKYISRKKGKNGKWLYNYGKESGNNQSKEGIGIKDDNNDKTDTEKLFLNGVVSKKSETVYPDRKDKKTFQGNKINLLSDIDTYLYKDENKLYYIIEKTTGTSFVLGEPTKKAAITKTKNAIMRYLQNNHTIKDLKNLIEGK